jgi:hypothetical protein
VAVSLRHRADRSSSCQLALERDEEEAVALRSAVCEPGVLVGVEQLVAELAVGHLALVVQRDGGHLAVAAQHRKARRWRPWAACPSSRASGTSPATLRSARSTTVIDVAGVAFCTSTKRPLPVTLTRPR